MQVRNIGIFASVDAGKTTLSEQLLTHSGMIRSAGSVDRGTAHTDDLPVERRRGISVRATCVELPWKGTRINLIDTPGHTDFSAEVERALWALDAAVLVVCGVEGVQPQTEALFHAFAEQKLPVLIYINKMDRENADADRVVAQLRRRLSPYIARVNDSDALTDVLTQLDDGLLETYLENGSVPTDTLMRAAREYSRRGDCFMVLSGSALHDTDVEPLLDAVTEYFPEPASAGRELSGVAFAAQQDRLLGRGVWIRLFGGKLMNRDAVTLRAGIDPLTGEEKLVQRKVTQIRSARGADTGELADGDIAVVYGLGNIPIGYTFGTTPKHIEPGHLRTPLITLQVEPEDPAQLQALRSACEVLSGEDPLLQASWSASLAQLHLRIMGMIQQEILAETLETRFGIKARFSKPAVIYRETIAQTAPGYVAYTMPKPCWAIMQFVIEPAPRGSGVTFASVVPDREILPRYQHQAAQAIPLALAQGRLGWQVTDVKITLVAGSHHQWHTHPLDFIVATPMGIQDGLRRGGSVLLEPILEITFLVPPECVGRVMSDVATMRGEVLSTLADDDRVELKALVPVATSLDYPSVLASVTGGRGGMNVRLHSYRDCPLELGATTPRRNVDPLDESRYILAARSALEGGIFDF